MNDSFRIATFNLENLDDRPPPALSLGARIAALRPILLRLEADILCLQEVNAQDHSGPERRQLAALDSLLAGTPYASFNRVWTRDRHGAGALDVHNLVVLSRFPILDSAQIRHDLVPAPLYRLVTATPVPLDAAAVEWDRPFLYARIDLGRGRCLHVVNLHLRAPLAAAVAGQKAGPLTWLSVAGWAEGFFLASMKRTGQALEARLFLDRLLSADSAAMIAVCGDLNSDLREMPVRVLLGDSDDTGNPSLADHTLWPATTLVPRQARYSVIHASRPALVDHVLVSAALKSCCRAAEILNQDLPDEAVPPGSSDYPGSYHAPVVAAFSLIAGAEGLPARGQATT